MHGINLYKQALNNSNILGIFSQSYGLHFLKYLLDKKAVVILVCTNCCG
jgi:hypothetical protein